METGVCEDSVAFCQQKVENYRDPNETAVINRLRDTDASLRYEQKRPTKENDVRWSQKQVLYSLFHYRLGNCITDTVCDRRDTDYRQCYVLH